MLPNYRSIFHLEEEDEEEDCKNAPINGGFVSLKDVDALVGLQILIHRKNDRRLCNEPAIMSVDFLRFCFFCGKELSLQKEVYMYRGDQGFCSAECRHKQILQDEKSEINASRRLRFGLSHHRHPRHLGSKVMKYNGWAKVSVAS